jgi:hypothetical protein
MMPMPGRTKSQVLRRFCGFAALIAAAISVLPVAATPPAPQAVLVVTEPAALQAAERAGAGFVRWFTPGERAPTGEASVITNDRLRSSPDWTAFTLPLRETVALIARRDRQAGVGVARNPHRLFDLRWLDSPTAFFELVGVVNRLDRRPFTAGACGETRLVYRLAYRDAALASRLPMTVAVELNGDAPDASGSCKAAVQLWQPPAGAAGERLGAWLTSTAGPLAEARLARTRIARITVNLQSVRWPSGVRLDLGGHAEYVLRAFRWNAGQGRYEPAVLENTPDLARLRTQPALRDQLLAFLREPQNLRALDEGSLQMPERFLAQEAVSVAPLGLSRLANRPFAQLFPDEVWPELSGNLSGNRTLGSPQAVLRRLDDLTCMGCHQSRSVAGFHLLGEDRPGVTRGFAAGNALAVPHSPHVQEELARRRTYADAALSQARPDPFRPPAGAGRVDGGFGEACGLGDPGFAGWSCGKGLSCLAHGEDKVGVCMPSAPAVGAVCEPAHITASANPWRDRAVVARARSCGPGGVCEATGVGFPGGMCSGSCNPLEPDGSCGRIAILSGFNQCLAARRPFAECLQNHTRPGQLRACSATQPCRDDYLCAQTGSGEPAAGAAATGGACIPPYFLFQMRVDGHP